jgi:hypothetical protein
MRLPFRHFHEIGMSHQIEDPVPGPEPHPEFMAERAYAPGGCGAVAAAAGSLCTIESAQPG